MPVAVHPMHRWSPSRFVFVSLAATFLSFACTTRENYLELDGPRYEADYSAHLVSRAPETLKIVSYNVKYGEKVGVALALLANTPELRDADIILLQEMHADGVDTS